MDEDWDNEPVAVSQPDGVNNAGRAFGKGRGFVAKINDFDNGNEGTWGSGDSHSSSNRGDGRRKDRGGRDFRPKRNDYNSHDNNDKGWDDANDNGGNSWSNKNSYKSKDDNFDSAENGGDSGWGGNNDFNSGGERRGRGGRGGRGGGRGGRGGDRDGGRGDRDGGRSFDRDGGRGDREGGRGYDRDGGRGDREGGRGFDREGGRGDREGGRGDREGGRGDREGGRGFDRDGGRGGDRDRDGGRGGEDGDGEEKKREIYIPPEISTDENVIFHSGNESGINFTKYDSIAVKTTGENVPPPIHTFSGANLREIVIDNINKSGYTKPTPIQKHSIPIVLNGRDLMACAQTGSGKTAAFLIPIIHKLLEEPSELVVEGDHIEPQCVIISPTRELASQIYDEAYKFAYKSILKICIAYGGTSVRYQMDRIMKGCHILVATPGRINDFVKRGNITFNATRFVVLDEADRMLDMGFLSSVEEVMEHESMVPTGERQTLMFSATFPEEIQLLAGKFLHNYVFVAVGIVGGACTDVEQTFYKVDKFSKRAKLLDILKEDGTERTLIFVETKRNADFLATFLSESNFPTTSIHGDRLQREREEALRDFKRGSRHILVATGVAARGLDIKNVKHVINFDLPKSIDEYVHRIGRTGRVGNRGKATSFFDGNHDGAISPALVRILKQAEQTVPDWLGTGAGSFQSDNSGFGAVDFRDGNFGNTQDVGHDEPEESW